ncbi:alpha/beta hydrolase [Rhizobium sp. XQZ8]|uniref:alpha/beta fold hydrolase n=1 Tax=Rhizobium populisoli TaxID=2859785 RepID=UPI001CA592B0|nr:alpha/beta fold hydrolase [Rhizobium populisoli]MBW6424421.1 alpha/beta hydrolase [Rhizobium populisoli]
MTDARSTISLSSNALPLPPRSAAEPLTFGGTVGLFTPPSAGVKPSSVAVLFASPWGLEEMCTRKFWRIIAENLADRGIASLRFDYPGTGDALDEVDFHAGLSVWGDSLVQAGERLRAFSGCSRIVVIAQGLGAAVATGAADRIEGLEAIAYLAPVVSGRMHLRELAVWSRVVDENLGLGEEYRSKDSASIASLTLPAEITEEVRRFNLMSLDRAPARRALVVARPDRPADKEFAIYLKALGVNVEEQPFGGYQQLVSNPAIARLPVDVAENLADWVAGLPFAADQSPVRRAIVAEPLEGNGFSETPVRFGSRNRLSGMLCEPSHGRKGATVLFLTSAYDRHAGWGRATVKMARALARSGIASLRFDTASAGDSPPVPGRPEQVLYHSTQNADVTEAIDFLESRRLTPVVAAGRCSGAYLAFQTSLGEPRIAGEVLVNPIVFRWKPGRSVDEAIVNGSRSLEDYTRRALRLETFRRIVRGEVNLTAAMRNVIGGIGARVRNKVLHIFRGFMPEGRAIYSAFRTLNERGTPVCLLYSEHDLGIEQYDFYFGHDGAGLARFPNVLPAIIPDADHNLTPEHARDIYFNALRQMAFRFVLDDAVTSKPRAAVAAE